MDIQGGEGTHPATQLEMTENSQAELSSGKTAPIFIKNNQLNFLAMLGLLCCTGFSLAVVSGGLFLGCSLQRLLWSQSPGSRARGLQ